MFRVLLDAARKHPAIKKALVEVTSETEHDVIDLNAFCLDADFGECLLVAPSGHREGEPPPSASEPQRTFHTRQIVGSSRHNVDARFL